MLFDKYRNLFQYAYQLNNLLFTHAGVTEDWFTEVFHSDSRKDVAMLLNSCTGHQEEALHHCGVGRGGSHAYGGICWANKTELENPLGGYVQVVGHNRVRNIEEWNGKNGAKVLFCDCLHNGNYLVIESFPDNSGYTFLPDSIYG